MFVELKEVLEVRDFTKPSNAPVEERWMRLEPGRHEVERIPHPWGLNLAVLVLKGTLLGGCEGWWKGWDFVTVLEE